MVKQLIKKLEHNRLLFQAELSVLSKEEQLWRPAPEKWCLHEIVCHLYDEEREDFRARIRHVLRSPNTPFAPIDPERWVMSRAYIKWDYNTFLEKFMWERSQSVMWLNTVNEASLKNAVGHQHFGEISGEYLLHNWLAHDYLHLRQINRYKYFMLKESNPKISLEYAGGW